MPRAEMLDGRLAKMCSKCERVFFNPEENFNKQKDKPDGLQYQCKECHSETAKAWLDAHKDDPEYRKRKAEQSRKWREDNPDWMEVNRERNTASKRDWYEKNREKVKANVQSWKTENRDLVIEYQRKRRATSGTGYRKLDTMLALYRLQDGHCCYTGDPLPVPENPATMDDFKDVVVDHVHPIVHGGNSDFDNLCLTAESVNAMKNDTVGYPHREGMWV